MPPLGEGDLERIADGLRPGETKDLLDGYLDRMLDCYAQRPGLPETLVRFLREPGNRVSKEVFVSALDPRHDDVARAAQILEELRVADEQKFAKYVHLATAIAVVHDSEAKVRQSRRQCVMAVADSQFCELPAYRDVWEYYTDERRFRRARFALDRLPWCILVHLVDNDTNQADHGWALSKYDLGYDVAKLYRSVPYDYDKMNGKTPKLGTRKYNLPNLLSYGGVCADQAYFATRVAKCLGVPAMKVSGTGRYGGVGHAWAGFLVFRKGRPVLEFTGRYFGDYYYTGDIFDPQTGTMTLDRYVAMMYDGASLSYPKYNDSRMMTRMAEGISEGHKKESLELTQKALELNYFNMHGWPLLMKHIEGGTLSKKDGLKWFNGMIRALKDHPDITYACLGTFIGCLPEKQVRKRQSLYDQAARLYTSRPDLILKLRDAQAKELVAAEQKLKALNLLIVAVVQNPKEGKLVLPALRMAVTLAKELGLGRQAHAKLQAADAEFPKMRGSEPSASYGEFKRLLDQLK